MSYGLNPDGFWNLTPREIAARIEGARRRLIAEQDGRAWLAWHVAALSRQTKLPDLETILTQRKQPEPQGPAEQAVALDALFLAWGGDPAELARARPDRGST